MRVHWIEACEFTSRAKQVTHAKRSNARKNTTRERGRGRDQRSLLLFVTFSLHLLTQINAVRTKKTKILAIENKRKQEGGESSIEGEYRMNFYTSQAILLFS